MVNLSTLTGTVTWADGNLVNGYAVVRLIPPKGTTGDLWASLFAGKIKIPTRTVVPITDGAFEPTQLIYNSDISPPNSKYVMYYYDLAGNSIGNPDSIDDAFTVSTATTTPPIYITEVSEEAIDLPESPV